MTSVNPYISATEFDNFVLNDTICDCLATIPNNKRPNPHPLQILFNKGILYEEKIVNLLRSKTGLALNKLSSLQTSRMYNSQEDTLWINDLYKTIDLMKVGEPILYSPFIYNKKESLRGIPDLLVRNDYISNIFKIAPECQDGYSNFGNYYYIPVEIKFSTTHLDRSSIYIENINRTKIYKTQLFTYCKILEEIQGILPKNAFIISKRVMDSSGNILDPLVNPGIIDYTSRDNNIVKVFYEGVEWLRYVKNNKWSIDKIIKEKIYPNMKVINPIYQSEKEDISKKINEITQFFYCNTKSRQNAFDHGITSWKDPKLDSNILGFNEKSDVAKRINLLLKINKGELGDYYFPKRGNSIHLFDWKNNIQENEMFVDFETVTQDLDIEIQLVKEERIFLIGVLYKNSYHSFIIKDLSLEEEKRILKEFYNFWKDNNKPKIWYWYAETTMFERANQRHNSSISIPMYDLHKIFYEMPFVVKGCKNFKLKSYIKALKTLEKIDIELPPETCEDGLKAMFLAYEYYSGLTKYKTLPQNIIDYNKLDCQYLEILLKFLRDNVNE